MTSHRPVPGRLRAPAPGWTTRADVVVVGSGIAGLTAALRIHAANPSLRLLVVTKDVLAAGSTQWAQGGIAAALGPGDATGAEIQRALIAAVERAPEIEVVQHALAVDLLRSADGGVAGLTLHVLGEGQHDGVGAVLCRAVVLASGGLGQVFSQSTNPSVSTGDGTALAMRAGARVRDL